MVVAVMMGTKTSGACEHDDHSFAGKEDLVNALYLDIKARLAAHTLRGHLFFIARCRMNVHSIWRIQERMR